MSVVHQELPPKNFELEFVIAITVGYASFEDGSAVAVKSVTQDGDPLTLVVPIAQVEALITALRQAKNVAISKMAREDDGTKTIFTPKTYDTITTPGYDGVLLAFDRGAPSELIVGIDHVAARNMGASLKSQARAVAARPRIIIPHREIG